MNTSKPIIYLTLWFTGRPCSGKSTIAWKLREEMARRGIQAASLDGDDVRGKLSADLGFSEKDRKENLRRVAHVARLFNENGNFVIASFVSPLEENRDMIRSIIPNFKLCYVKCSLELAEKRDVKGMYKKARLGEIKDFTGIDSAFEEPKQADIVVDTEKYTVHQCVQQILKALNI